MKKQTIPLRSSKENILKDKGNLPQKIEVKPQKPPDAAPEVKGKKVEVKPPDAAPEVKERIPGPGLDLEKLLPPTGTIKAIGCNGFSLLLNKKGRLPLNFDQYKMLGDPLDKVEAEVIKLLPAWLKEQVEKNSPLAGAIMEAATLAFVIWELNKKPAAPREKNQRLR
ncbi:MAG: hypothetical protein PHP10_03655 [Candidatus Omnitrophica bacterium]|nr:hypothetical protein [Candidatus Omnitrophota bacterium]